MVPDFEKKWMTTDEVQEQFGHLASVKEIFYDWMGLNQWLFFHINHVRASFYDSLMLWVTELGNKHHFPYVVALLALFSIMGLVIHKLKKRGGTKQYIIRWIAIFLVLIGGFAVNAIVISGMKSYFSLPRPYAAFDQNPVTGNANERVYILESQESEKSYQSFPSGHVAMITLIVSALWPILSERGRYFGGFLIFAVGWSRVSLGVHFPADAVWAVLITLLVVFMVRGLVHRLLRGIFGLHC